MAVIFQWSDSEIDFYSSLMTTMCSVGSAIGAISIGPFTKYGKKNCIIMANIFVVVGTVITLIQSEIAIICGRFIYGIAAGTFSVLVPVFSKNPYFSLRPYS